MGRNEGQPGGSDLLQGGPEFRYTPRNDIQPGKMGVTALGYESPQQGRGCLPAGAPWGALLRQIFKARKDNFDHREI